MQYAAASAVLLAVGAVTETMTIRWTGDFVLALVWLVLALSLGAVLLLLFLLRSGTAAGVSSLLYLVPPAVAVEAYLLYGERLTGLSLVGVGVTALGVALVSPRCACGLQRESRPSADADPARDDVSQRRGGDGRGPRRCGTRGWSSRARCGPSA